MKDFYQERTHSNQTCSFSSTNTSIKLDSSNISVNENSTMSSQDCIENEEPSEIQNHEINSSSEVSKEIKSKRGMPHYIRCANTKPPKQHPLSVRKCLPTSNHLTNASAKVVLLEKNMEIKDLESKVKYLLSKIKELESENKTVQSIQSHQERELKRFREGVADIPSLLRSHKEETKAYESTITNIRNELRDCQKDLKVKNESLLKKDSQIDKFNVLIKRNEKSVHDLSNEIKELNATIKGLEEENKMLVEALQNLKCEKEDLHKNIKLTKETSLNKNNSNRMLFKLKQNPENKVSKRSVSFDFNNVTFKKAATKLTAATQFFIEPKLSQTIVNNNMQNQIQKLEENIAQETNINQQLKEKINKFEEKYTKKNNEVSEELHELVLNEYSNFHGKGDSSKIKISVEISPEFERKKLGSSLENFDKKLGNSLKNQIQILENIPENENKKSENFLADESKNLLGNRSNESFLLPGESLDEFKGDLVYTYKQYQDLCNTTFSCDAGNSYGIKASSLKLLPPLKQPSRRSFQNMDSSSANKEYFSSEISFKEDIKLSADKRLKIEKMFWHSDEFEKEFQNKLNINDCETQNSESKILVLKDSSKNSCFSESPKQNNSFKPFQIEWLDDIKTVI